MQLDLFDAVFRQGSKIWSGKPTKATWIIAYMKKQTVKRIKTVTPKKVQKAQPVKPKLSKQDPNYYSKIGALSAAKRKLNSDYFSRMAKASHKPGCRDGYHGGRKKKAEE